MTRLKFLLILAPFSLLFGAATQSITTADLLGGAVAIAGAIGWLVAAWQFAKRQP